MASNGNTNPRNLPATQQQKAAAVRTLLDKSKTQFAMALPRHLDVDRLLRVAMTSIMRTPKLLDCDQQSLLGAIMQAAQLGLEPDGVLGHAYLVPFKGKVTLIVGYKGLLDMARRSGEVVSIQAHVVYDGDEFDYAYGLKDTLYHKPTLGGRGDPIAAYAAAVLKEGGHAFEVMGVGELNAIRDASQGYKAAKEYNKDSPWDTHWDEMARKTVVRRLAKYLPISVEFQRAAADGEMFDAGVHPDLPTLDVDPEPPAEDEAEVSNLLAQLMDACPTSAPEPPDSMILADFVRQTADTLHTTRTAVIADARENAGGFYAAYFAFQNKNRPKPGVSKKDKARDDELRARTEKIDPATGEVLDADDASLFDCQPGA